jgi:hypothetical protein
MPFIKRFDFHGIDLIGRAKTRRKRYKTCSFSAQAARRCAAKGLIFTTLFFGKVFRGYPSRPTSTIC